MPNWILVTGDSGFVVAFPGFTQYINPCGELTFNSTEAKRSFVARDTYTLSKLFVRITANTLDVITTIKTRKAGGDGNQSVAIGAATTGTFQDMVNTDALADGNLFCYQYAIPAGTGQISISIVSTCLQTASNNTPIIGGRANVENANLTLYAPLGGFQDPGATEANTQYTFRVSATLSNLRGHVSVNGLTAVTTVTMRVNGADVNETLSIGAGATGAFEDVVNTDAIASGNSVNIKIVTGATGANIRFDTFQLKSTSAGRQTMAAWAAAGVMGSNQTWYGALEDLTGPRATAEADAQVITEIAFNAKNYFVRVTANTLDGATTVAFRQNGITSALSVSIAATGTGVFEDFDSVAVAVDDLLNNMAATGGTGGSLSISIIGFELEQPTGPPPVGIENKSATMGAKMIGHKMI